MLLVIPFDVSIDDSGSEPAYPFMCPILQPLFVVRCKGLPPQFPRNKDFSEGMLMQPVRGVALPHSTASLIFVLVGAFFVAPTIIKATLYFLQRLLNGRQFAQFIKYVGVNLYPVDTIFATWPSRYKQCANFGL